jgi:glyoxylase-like metal-dependent hydrolase (beta-lactamase superfamily II)
MEDPAPGKVGSRPTGGTKEKNDMSGALPEAFPSPAVFGPVTVLFGEGGGRYPDGNSILIEGELETVLIDPALGLVGRADLLPPVDRVLNSHCHEDHVAGNHLFPDVPWQLHEADLPGLLSLDGMMAIYGFEGAVAATFRKVLVDRFLYSPRADPTPMQGGDMFDLGGVRLEVLHTPGHTRGHCCFMVSWNEEGRERRLLYLGDIELSSFGPYYGDAWSDLGDFERSLARVRDIEADWYATFHHIGVLEGREAFLARLDIFESMITDREQRLVEYLSEPRRMQEIVAHRFVFRPENDIAFADAVEQRSAEQHLDRLLASGKVRRGIDGRYIAA